MRIKDENKKEAISFAVIQLINEIGYANISMSKIAKLAGVSAATLYTYYENKEEMFKSVYLEVKKHMLSDYNKGVEVTKPVKQSIQQFCRNVVEFAEKHEEEFLFLNQSSNSPLVNPMSDSEIEQLHQKTYLVFDKGIQEGILKPASPYLLVGFCVYPIAELYKEQRKKKTILGEVNFELVFQMCWDAIKN